MEQNTILSEQFKNHKTKSWKETKSIHIIHKYMTAHFFRTGTSIKRGGVKLVLWTKMRMKTQICINKKDNTN